MLGVIIHWLISSHHPTDTGKSGLDCLGGGWGFLVGIFSSQTEMRNSPRRFSSSTRLLFVC